MKDSKFDLVAFKNKVLELCENRFAVFFTAMPLTRQGRHLMMQWRGEEIESFLTVAEELDLRVLYLHIGLAAEEWVERAGQVVQVEVGFWYNGILHVFINAPDWGAVGDVENEKEQSELTVKTVAELAAEAINFIGHEYPDLPTYIRHDDLQNIQMHFWKSKGVEIEGVDSWDTSDLARKIKQVDRTVRDQILRDMQQKVRVAVKKFLAAPDTEIVKELAERVEQEMGELPTRIYRFQELFQMISRKYWKDKGLDQYGGPEINLKQEKIEHRVEELFKRAVRRKEELLVERLIEECKIWCDNHKLSRLTKANLRVFLREKGVSLSDVGQNRIYLEINQLLSSGSE